MVWGISADTSDEEFWENQARNKRLVEEERERKKWREETKKDLKKEILEEIKPKNNLP